jgi:hypothetical protein
MRSNPLRGAARSWRPLPPCFLWNGLPNWSSCTVARPLVAQLRQTVEEALEEPPETAVRRQEQIAALMTLGHWIAGAIVVGSGLVAGALLFS